jgi:putative membrane protein
MIRNFTDHAANERTFLAWVRTAIAIMAFGFLIERFDLVMRMMAKATGETGAPVHYNASNLMGLLFIIMGIAIMVAATLRYRKNGREIDLEAIEKVRGGRFDTTFAILLVMLCVAMCLFLFQAFSSFV